MSFHGKCEFLFVFLFPHRTRCATLLRTLILPAKLNTYWGPCHRAGWSFAVVFGWLSSLGSHPQLAPGACLVGRRALPCLLCVSELCLGPFAVTGRGLVCVHLCPAVALLGEKDFP
ncbi:hypothetical protein H1C71_029376 [Ictidomys tridecemlineatus]|nr:hypothetical protein H1C71_029376 [Ictidomys tridecemlineatus]KAG3259755.1 hypothetical protein H1C71_029376 [Ictidomys tridecemlineatus]KAG3259756.1 hypothetical protein H1C71_029376 [Ictidomys tridecemlineatus]KAG3259757.1 hypothetical protein H1C71_029376 [Ictidomys tridecemlineatus]